MKKMMCMSVLLACTPAFAEETRELGAHEHGVGALDIAMDGTTVAMALRAPGADIVGFEYQAKSDADKASVAAAFARLEDPLALFVTPQAASCALVRANVKLEGGEGPDAHDHDDHDGHDDHKDHDDHGDHKDHDDHGHDDHADHKDHADHDDHAHETHDDHDHTEHAQEGGHTEFHAEYTLECANPAALDRITFAYFDAFENAKEVEVQMITPAGAQGFEITRDAPVLDIGG